MYRRCLGLVGILCLLSCASVLYAGPLTPEAGRDYIASTQHVFILDVRSRREFSARHIPGAHNIPIRQLAHRLDEIPMGRPVLIHCALGARALRAYQLLQKKRQDIQELYYIRGWPYFPPAGETGKLYFSLSRGAYNALHENP